MTPRAERRAGRRVAASARDGRRGRLAWRRLYRAAERGDEAARDGAVTIAGTPDHPLREPAGHAVAKWWAETRDPVLRRAVLELGTVAYGPPALLQTAALLGRLGDVWHESFAGWVPVVLADPDPDVRERAAAFCREATGPVLSGLWEHDGGPGTPLREVLLANGEPPTSGPLNRLWREWIGRPDGALWEALSGWGRPAVGGEFEGLSLVAIGTDPDVLREPWYRKALIAALKMGDHPLCGIAEERLARLRDQGFADELCAAALEDDGLVRVCRKHRLAPADPVRRVAFFLLTGQPEQHRAMDPDGSLLALAYASAPGAERDRMRRAMLSAGELDLVRVIVGDDRRARISEMPPEEVRYLAERLAERREWHELWALVQDVPIATGVELLPLLGDWAPRGDDERRVFELYRAAAPDALARGVGWLEPFRSTVSPRARLLFHGRVNDVSFAPDGPFLAVGGTNRVAGVFDLRSAELVERYGGFEASVGRVLHMADGALVAAERTIGFRRECRVLHCVDGGTRTLHKGPGSVTSLARTRDGGFVAGTRSGSLLLGAPDGGPVETLPAETFGVHDENWPRAVAVHGPSGRVAVLSRRVVVADPGANKPHMTAHNPATAWTAFVDADTLVCAERGGDVQRLHADAFPRELPVTGQVRLEGVRGLGELPGTGEIVAVDSIGNLHVLDGGTLARTTVHRAPEPGRPTSVTVSPSGDFLAVGDAAGRTDLFDLRVREVPEIVGRPVVDLVPRHLGIVATALTVPALDPAAEAALRLLEACLEHRFRFDVELGDAVRLSAGEHDISL